MTELTVEDFDKLRGSIHANGGRLTRDYEDIQLMSAVSGTRSTSGYILGTLRATDKSLSLDSPAELLVLADDPRANYELERIGIIGTSLDLTAEYRIIVDSEIGSSEVPLLAESFTPSAAADNFSFELNVVVPQGSIISCKITSSKTPGTPPGLSVGLLYGRIR